MTRFGIRSGLNRRLHLSPGEIADRNAAQSYGHMLAYLLRNIEFKGIATKLTQRNIPSWWTAKARSTELHIMQLLQDRRITADGTSTQSRKRKHYGPCWFPCCNGSPYTNKEGNVVWYPIPSPSPWFGVPAGATVCTRHRAIAIKAAKRAKHYLHTAWHDRDDPLPGTSTKRPAAAITDHIEDPPPHRKVQRSSGSSTDHLNQ